MGLWKPILLLSQLAPLPAEPSPHPKRGKIERCAGVSSWQGVDLWQFVFIVNMTGFRITAEAHLWACLWKCFWSMARPPWMHLISSVLGSYAGWGLVSSWMGDCLGIQCTIGLKRKKFLERPKWGRKTHFECSLRSPVAGILDQKRRVSRTPPFLSLFSDNGVMFLLQAFLVVMCLHRKPEISASFFKLHLSGILISEEKNKQ